MLTVKSLISFDNRVSKYFVTLIISIFYKQVSGNLHELLDQKLKYSYEYKNLCFDSDAIYNVVPATINNFCSISRFNF